MLSCMDYWEALEADSQVAEVVVDMTYFVGVMCNVDHRHTLMVNCNRWTPEALVVVDSGNMIPAVLT